MGYGRCKVKDDREVICLHMHTQQSLPLTHGNQKPTATIWNTNNFSS
jgi:hypothetical protein